MVRIRPGEPPFCQEGHVRKGMSGRACQEGQSSWQCEHGGCGLPCSCNAQSLSSRCGFSMHSGHCWRPPCRCANNVQIRSNGIRQPFVTTGGGALPLPLPIPAQPATLTATRVATNAMSTFFIGVPLSSRHAMHTSCLAVPLVARRRQCVHCLRRQWGTSKETVSLGTHLGAPSFKTRVKLN